jgi:hypothetical protein
MPTITFTIEGQVNRMVEFVPTEFKLGDFSVDQSASASIRVYGFEEEPIRLVSHTIKKESTRDFFELSAQEISRDDIDFPGAQSGLVLEVTAKPGLPLGSLLQEVEVITNLESEVAVPLKIEGQVSSDISITGDYTWNNKRNVLEIGMVGSAKGFRKQLRILVRGTQRDNTRFEIARIDPPELKAELGEQTLIPGSAVLQVPLRISLPEGAPPMTRLGSAAGDPVGKIILKTTHPNVPELPILVQFAVKQ